MIISVPCRTFQHRVAPGGGVETFRAVLSSAELSRAETRRGIVSSPVLTPAVKFEMPIIHRIINFCITATLKTGGAYYTQVRIISDTLR